MAEVFRINKTKNYTVMSNYHLKDKKLSFKAKGPSLRRRSSKSFLYLLISLTNIFCCWEFNAILLTRYKTFLRNRPDIIEQFNIRFNKGQDAIKADW